MKLQTYLLSLSILSASLASAQTIEDIWETTSDKKSLLRLLPSSAGIDFKSNSIESADAEIDVHDTQIFQTVFGFGASLTDSSAIVFNKLKTTNVNTYNALLNAMFNSSDGANSAGINYIRVPLGASDFSPRVYSYDDQNLDLSLSSFSIDAAPPEVFSTLHDIQSINKQLKIHLVPWSPPGWMKDSGTMNGGNFLDQYSDTMALYLFKSVQSFSSKGMMPYAISIQNEPQSVNPTLPSAKVSASSQAKVGVKLRSLLDSNGFNSVKVIGYEHNWDGAAAYASDLMREPGAMDTFAGVAFHCYGGNVAQQDSFYLSFPTKEVYFTECTGVPGSDWWSDIQFYMKNIFVGGINHHAQSGLMWNLVVDPQGNPKLPGATSCGKGCRGVAQVSADGTVQLNQELFAMAHAAKAILPKDEDGPFGRRLGYDLSGNAASALTVGAYVTQRANAGNPSRYSLVVMNSGHDTVKTAIAFRNSKATYTFPIGLTTLSWYASSPS